MTLRTDSQAQTRHGPIAQLLISSSPLGLILILYVAAAWISSPLERDLEAVNRVGRAVSVIGPVKGDMALFGDVPTVWLQALVTGPLSAVLEVAAALVYVTHFAAIPLVTAVTWFRARERYLFWIIAVLVFTGIGVTGYVLYPAAPPWMAAELGVIGPVERTSGAGWSHLAMPWVGAVIEGGQGLSNQVAAMPSLHAGATLLVTLFVWASVSGRWRWGLVGYVVVMAWALVHTGEHYVVDILAGWLVAVAAVTGTSMLRLRRDATAP